MTDLEWLLKMLPDAQESIQEAFLERVAIYVYDAGFSEDMARNEAYNVCTEIKNYSI